MAVGKEIRTKISSIKNTQKITRAMEMVAASKMRKTKDRMQATRPYSKKIGQIIKHLAHANPEYKHPFLISRETKRVGLIIISSDRGLCGGLNSNLFRKTISSLVQWEKDGIEVDVCTVGTKAFSFFSSLKTNLVGQVSKLGDAPHLQDIVGIIKKMLDAYNNGQIDQLYIANNDFVNTMTQRPTIQQLLPVVDNETEEKLNTHWDYIYEPDAKEVLDYLLVRYIESIVYQGLVENNACEQAARMVAMKSASDNAGNLISELQLVYNKARQAAITQEISEIVAGAAAV
ncbi:MAG: F0F1 ATP synthase subunit gamma [Methylococcaceae bacterium]|uniref:F0F1 ATP synthase subunit gamma n=1 Tax=Methylicorpusculum sp. TaxID=2713644 RepID=UPI002718F448|nr:F0F1 ATP synthase subunit gamma [Methylicorpusculum sp.]MDO9162412.1 F0F1 ATP synthase subunit gamma [Methylococcaceae bacterium]MDZ4157529.1 F0F1 ATP synthase subunit gamma [Methylococcales bacterium]MDP2394891.1 F0F1 ATP synthase subunit gamma [Methylococcaceae bacterium]MDP3019362.1 F0F1 ATP synthase subunit gamma [Methylococcaceae bacterium]MDP3389043.1 F0F1 ATP synthase subunit gamma [Methylococcaceae bacterium]